MTSSCLSVFCVSEANRPNGKFTEANWSEPEACEENYSKSKVLAEKAAWKFMEDLPAEEKFELTTVLPAFVMGPPLTPASGTSTGFVQGVLSGGMAEIPGQHVPCCDVREVAKAHVLATKNKKAAGKRFMVVNEKTPSFHEYAAPLIAKYKPLGYPITDVMGEIDPEKYVPQFDNSAVKGLGIKMRPFDETMVDMAEKMIELGMVQKPAAA